ncbi:ketopantoate reductase family protein [Gracilibacillus caseinilyticus]|uniref:2-dehydropantoate 2-reductase n=1 Tax=Gracilibacillus caseinilyticus TaxID=2932256 RepID=A0ABY4EWA8_9BACI|nr:ketopantoate reductase family protein [Gracilibacillus caseinilyticus]UOQ48260.1 ketopantoate reductase family protein [Gracilibacillus caseinilyticus]
MNIAIIGAGALGSYFGVRWLRAGANVQFIVREKRAKQLHEQGLALHSVKGDDQIQSPSIITNPKDAVEADVIVIAVKGYHLDAVIHTLKALAGPNTFLLPIMNGVAHYQTLADHFGENKVLGGLANIIATLDEHGHVKHTSEIHEVWFGALHHSQQQICEQLAELSQKANMRATYSEKISTDIWYKYMFITAFSGITTVSELEIGPILKHQATRDVLDKLFQEMQQIANAEKVDLTERRIEKAWSTIQQLPEHATSSMHQDYRKGLPLELEHLHGAAIAIAKKHQLEVPVIQTIYGIIKAKS